MITIGNKKAHLYKGAYKPVRAMKNGKEIAGYTYTGSTETEFEVSGTYDDFVTVYGKTAYSAASNDLPPSPDNVKEILHASGKLLVTDKNGEAKEYELPELKGIEVSKTAPYNYTETVDGVTKYYIADSLENGKIIRRIGKHIIDENADFKKIHILENTCRITINSLLDRITSLNEHELSSSTICDKFVSEFGYAVSNQEYDCEHTSSDYSTVSQYQFVFINKERLEDISLEGAKKWLKENNITLYYPLNEPTIENVDLKIKSCPQKTKIKIIGAENAPKAGLAKCLKVSK